MVRRKTAAKQKSTKQRTRRDSNPKSSNSSWQPCAKERTNSIKKIPRLWITRSSKSRKLCSWHHRGRCTLTQTLGRTTRWVIRHPQYLLHLLTLVFLWFRGKSSQVIIVIPTMRHLPTIDNWMHPMGVVKPALIRRQYWPVVITK